MSVFFESPINSSQPRLPRESAGTVENTIIEIIKDCNSLAEELKAVRENVVSIARLQTLAKRHREAAIEGMETRLKVLEPNTSRLVSNDPYIEKRAQQLATNELQLTKNSLEQLNTDRLKFTLGAKVREFKNIGETRFDLSINQLLANHFLTEAEVNLYNKNKQELFPSRLHALVKRLETLNHKVKLASNIPKTKIKTNRRTVLRDLRDQCPSLIKHANRVFTYTPAIGEKLHIEVKSLREGINALISKDQTNSEITTNSVELEQIHLAPKSQESQESTVKETALSANPLRNVDRMITVLVDDELDTKTKLEQVKRLANFALDTLGSTDEKYKAKHVISAKGNLGASLTELEYLMQTEQSGMQADIHQTWDLLHDKVKPLLDNDQLIRVQPKRTSESSKPKKEKTFNNTQNTYKLKLKPRTASDQANFIEILNEKGKRIREIFREPNSKSLTRNKELLASLVFELQKLIEFAERNNRPEDLQLISSKLPKPFLGSAEKLPPRHEALDLAHQAVAAILSNPEAVLEAKDKLKSLEIQRISHPGKNEVRLQSQMGSGFKPNGFFQPKAKPQPQPIAEAKKPKAITVKPKPELERTFERLKSHLLVIGQRGLETIKSVRKNIKNRHQDIGKIVNDYIKNERQGIEKALTTLKTFSTNGVASPREISHRLYEIFINFSQNLIGLTGNPVTKFDISRQKQLLAALLEPISLKTKRYKDGRTTKKLDQKSIIQEIKSIKQPPLENKRIREMLVDLSHILERASSIDQSTVEHIKKPLFSLLTRLKTSKDAWRTVFDGLLANAKELATKKPKDILTKEEASSLSYLKHALYETMEIAKPTAA